MDRKAVKLMRRRFCPVKQWSMHSVQSDVLGTTVTCRACIDGSFDTVEKYWKPTERSWLLKCGLVAGRAGY